MFCLKFELLAFLKSESCILLTLLCAWTKPSNFGGLRLGLWFASLFYLAWTFMFYCFSLRCLFERQIELIVVGFQCRDQWWLALHWVAISLLSFNIFYDLFVRELFIWDSTSIVPYIIYREEILFWVVCNLLIVTDTRLMAATNCNNKIFLAQAYKRLCMLANSFILKARGELTGILVHCITVNHHSFVC